MMKRRKRRLVLVLALMSALQSLAAIGDATRPHHPDTFHHAHEHSHETGVINAGSVDIEYSSTSSAPSLDHASDHCHQNHAHFHTMLLSTDIAVLIANLLSADYQANHTSVTPASLFRPPIA